MQLLAPLGATLAYFFTAVPLLQRTASNKKFPRRPRNLVHLLTQSQRQLCEMLRKSASSENAGSRWSQGARWRFRSLLCICACTCTCTVHKLRRPWKSMVVF